MNRLYCLILVLYALTAGAQPAPKSGPQPAPKPGPQPVPKPDSAYHIRYDHSALRIPGKNFSIGLIIPAQGRNTTDTIGYPGKKSGWSKYRLSVDSGSFSGGTVKLKSSEAYKRHDSVTVNVYARKWLLGGKGKFLASRKIPYNYEDSITLLTNGNTDRSPGDHLKFGVRTIYDDKQFADQWFPTRKKNSSRFLLAFDGAHLSRSKGDLTIDKDPTHITNDRIRLFARLAKDSAIGDTLELLLDYTAQYKCQIRSGDAGHPLAIDADLIEDSIIHARLLRVEVFDSTTKKLYHYLVNTNGGSLAISSKGGDGMDGRSGSDGASGLNGSDGLISTDVQTTTAADGSLQTTTTTTQGAGGDGGNGSPGEDGENGGNGFDGGNIVVHYTAAAAPFIDKLKATSIAGSGGSGGRGGTGGSGGSGGQGTPPGNSGFRGLDGRDGSEGNNGNAGAVRFVQDR